MSEDDNDWENHLMKEIKQQAELIWDLKVKISELEHETAILKRQRSAKYILAEGILGELNG